MLTKAWHSAEADPKIERRSNLTPKPINPPTFPPIRSTNPVNQTHRLINLRNGRVSNPPAAFNLQVDPRSLPTGIFAVLAIELPSSSTRGHCLTETYANTLLQLGLSREQCSPLPTHVPAGTEEPYSSMEPSMTFSASSSPEPHPH